MFDERNDDPGGFDRLRGPKVENAGGTVEIVFARCIEFFKDVKEVVTLAGSIAVAAVRLGGFYKAFGDVNVLDTHIGFRPVPGPEAMHPNVIVRLPGCRPIAVVVEAVFTVEYFDVSKVRFGLTVGGGGNGCVIIIRPTGDSHRLIVKKEFQRSCNLGMAKTATGELSKIGDSLGFEVALEDVGSGGFGKTFENGGIRNGSKAGYFLAASKPDQACGVGAIDDGI